MGIKWQQEFRACFDLLINFVRREFNRGFFRVSYIDTLLFKNALQNGSPGQTTKPSLPLKISVYETDVHVPLLDIVI